MNFKFSLRGFLLVVVVFGAAPLWYQNFVGVFAVILVSCILLAMSQFAADSADEPPNFG